MKHWTPEEDAALKRLYATTASAREIGLALSRSRPSIKNRVNTLGLKKPEGITNSGRFLPGKRSWNKGRKGLDMGGRSRETRFKPGHRGGKAVELYQPVGAERLDADGYLRRKLNDDMPLHKRWRAVHLILWEEVNGPLPAGHAVVFRNGDKTDIRIDNLECITRRELMARNTVHNLPEALREVVLLKAAVIRKINRISKEQQT